MTLLVSGLVIFFGIHLLSATALRGILVQKMTEKGFKGFYALVSLVGLLLIIIGSVKAPFHYVWQGVPELRILALPVMWLSFVLLPAAHMKGNVKRFTRHPMLWGITLWAGLHFVLNGDLAAMLLFGSFVVYSLFAMVSQTARGAMKQQVTMPIKYDLIVAAAGTTVFIIVLLLHGVLFGIPLL